MKTNKITQTLFAMAGILMLNSCDTTVVEAPLPATTTTETTTETTRIAPTGSSTTTETTVIR